MLGYILASIVGLVLVALAFAALAGGRKATTAGKAAGRTSQPAADEPTPDRSVTATAREMDEARRHTPPA